MCRAQRHCRAGRKVLASALLSLLAAAVWPTVKIVHIKAAIARVEAAGGKVVVFDNPNCQTLGFLPYYSLLTGNDKISVVLNGSAYYRRRFDRHRTLSGLSDLRLDGTAVTSAGLQRLPDHRNFQRLSLMGTAIDDAGLASLQDMANLRSSIWPARRSPMPACGRSPA